MKKNKKNGFTLVEMLIVLVIISVLSLLLLPSISPVKQTAESERDKALVQIVQTQMELYQLKYGSKPTSQELADKDFITDEQHTQYTIIMSETNE